MVAAVVGCQALVAVAEEKAPATTQSSAPPATIVSPLGKKMVLKFNDEFDAVPAADNTPYIDLKKWQTTFWQGSSERTLVPNGEAQYYMDRGYGGKNKIPVEQRPDPFSFPTPGILTISATKTPRELWGNYWMSEQRCFSSGLLISDKRFTFKYGYIEGRFKLPANRGAWPAFWLLPNDPSKPEPKNHPWPPEFDIFEAFGHRPTKFTTNLIAPKSEKTKVGQFLHDVDEDLSKNFHTWGFEWDENTAVWTFDGRELTRATVTPAFRVPMYILINLAVGGTWYSEEMKKAGTPFKPWEVDEASMPWKMECDFVRVYQEPAPSAAEPATKP